ncbi:hypothetical protein H4S07_000801 [Coemansia furcata]|uniref:Uncharacterized protein n=1 Tax=Coemansia furcata TaxID=417177 RepID=A0ACC1LQG4_9FUNG|nr:hypothetical protein H4S07_000801 [Coemansia furcata]
MDNFNFFNLGDIPVVPAPDRIQQLEAMLQQVSDESSQKDRTVASYGAAVTEANMRIFGLNLTVADYRRRVGMLERNDNAHRAVNLDLGQKLGDRDRTVSAQALAIYELTNQLNRRDRTIGECRSSIASYEQTTVSQALEVIDLGNKLNERDSTIADLQRTVTELQHANSDLMHTNGEQEHTIADLQCTVAALQHRDADHVRANSEQKSTIANLQHTVAALQHRDSAHVRTINGLQRTVTDLQHANTGHVQTIDELERANADQQSQLNEAHCTSAICLGGINYLMNRYTEYEYGAEIHRQSLDAAIPPPDILADDDDSDVTDMAVDIPTSADTVATTSATSPAVTSPVIDPLPGLPLPSFDLADTARHESLGAIYDQSGAEVTSERLLAAVKPFIYISPDVVFASYHETHHCQLIPYGIKPHEFIKTLAKLDGFGHLTLRLSSEHSARLAHVNFLQRCDLELETLRDDILGRLGLTKDLTAVVLSPVLCYTLVILCGTRMDQMTGLIIDIMFTTATDVKLQLLWVTTVCGTHQMSASDLCHMVKAWVEGLCQYITHNGIESSLDMARQCSNEYARRRSAGSGNSMANVAAEMLKHNEHFSQLFLGVGEDKLTILHRVIPHLMGIDTSS